MKYCTLANTCAILLILMGGTVIYGWISHIPVFVQILPGMVGMVFNTAAVFIMIGLALIIVNFPPFKYQSIIQRIILYLILFISIASMLQDILHLDFGIDRLFVTPWLNDPNPTPGRMAPNTDIGFILSAMIGLLLPYARKRYVAITIQFFTLLILLIALFGFLVYSLQLEFLFSWYRYTRMSVPTATGFAITSMGWYFVWSQSAWIKEFYRGQEDKKIVMITGIIVLCLTLIAGLGAIAALTYMNFRSLQQSLQESLKNNTDIFVNSINEAEENALSVVKNPLLSQAIQHADNINNYNLNQLMDLLSLKGFSALQILNAQGKILESKGNFIQASALSVPLTLPGKAILLWKDGFWLKLSIPISTGPDNKISAYFNAETPLTSINQMYSNYQGLGETGEILICHKLNEYNAECFPTRFASKAFNTPLIIKGTLLPINFAFNGQNGTVATVDYRRENVIAAYSPIANYGLGMVVKIDADEVYKPIRNQLEFMFPTALFLISCGLVLLYLQVVPLVRKVVYSERVAEESKIKLLVSNKKLEASISQLNILNKEMALLNELSAALQSCASIQEAYALIARYGQKILPDISGILYLKHPSYTYLESVASWGNPTAEAKRLQLADCLGLRRGAVYKHDNPHSGETCPHSKDLGSQATYNCIPLAVQDEVMGLLYIQWKNSEKTPDNVTDDKTNQQILALTLSELIALSLTNINLRDKLRDQSIHDPLTSLYNRRYLQEALERDLNRMKRESLPLALLMIDIDHFKRINDTFGHDAGDAVLQALAKLLSGFIRSGDIVCRYGGEEFIVVLPTISLDVALQRASELHKTISQLTIPHGTNSLGQITISIGLAMYPAQASNATELITAADSALYKAKDSGRNKTVVFGS